MHSSGQLAETVPLVRECENACGFNGRVDALYDPEISTEEVEWSCPKCGTNHTETRD